MRVGGRFVLVWLLDFGFLGVGVEALRFVGADWRVEDLLQLIFLVLGTSVV